MTAAARGSRSDDDDDSRGVQRGERDDWAQRHILSSTAIFSSHSSGQPRGQGNERKGVGGRGMREGAQPSQHTHTHTHTHTFTAVEAAASRRGQTMGSGEPGGEKKRRRGGGAGTTTHHSRFGRRGNDANDRASQRSGSTRSLTLLPDARPGHLQAIASASEQCASRTGQWIRRVG
jgi:hypothetical protein